MGPKLPILRNNVWKKNSESKQYSVDTIENTLVNSGRTSLIDRLLAETCEWCGAQGVPLEMHHVKKLKDLEGKKKWEQRMIARRRKTIAMCIPCHQNLHKGKLD